MPFDPTPLPLRPWIPTKEAETALRDLSARVRHAVPDRFWRFMTPGGKEDNECGAYGCALGHSSVVRSCVALMEKYDLSHGSGDSIDDALIREGVHPMVVYNFFYGPYSSLTSTTRFDVADRIDHWLATGEIR